MQATAPSSSEAPQAGHLVGPGAAPPLPLPKSGAEGGRLDGAGAAATGVGAAGAGTAVAGTTNGLLHVGQRTCLPPTLSGTCIDLVQCGQRMTCGMGLVLIKASVSVSRKT